MIRQDMKDTEKTNLRWPLILQLPLILSLLFFNACENKSRTDQEEQLGKPSPVFALKDFNGNRYSLDQWKGKVVLLRFWATRCESCKIEMPKLQSSFRNMMADGLVVIAVNVEDPPEKTGQFVRELGLTFPNLIDENGKVTKLYQVYGVPTTFLIDRKGIIRERIFGDLNKESIENIVKPLL